MDWTLNGRSVTVASVNLLASQVKLALTDLLAREGYTGRVVDRERPDGATVLAVFLGPPKPEPIMDSIRALLAKKGIEATVEERENARGERVIGVIFARA